MSPDDTLPPRLSDRLHRLAHSRIGLVRQLHTLLQLLATLRRPFASQRLGSELLTRLRHGQRHFQGSTLTLEDRFPILFAQCRLQLAGVARPRILSFGCSTGEEVFTLARYLPNAEIVGVDLNRWCLRECRRRNTNPNLRFLHSLSPEFEQLSGFDAVFCLAVFQRTENAFAGGEALPQGFQFASFERALADLDRKLRPGGLLFLDQTDFSFADTSVASRYAVVAFPHSARRRERPLFGRNDELVAAGYSSERVFRKMTDG